MTIEIRRLDTSDTNFSSELETLLAWESVSDNQVQKIVTDILADVKTRGDDAVIEYSNRFDHLHATSMDQLELSQDQLEDALNTLPADQRHALLAAADRVRKYHDKQKQDSWQYTEEDGT
jgi:histidinol dehydrogenase